MAAAERICAELKFTFFEGETLSDAKNACMGAFGTVIVPTGSDLIGKELQFVAHSPKSPALYDDTELLSVANVITLVAGSNPLDASQIAEVGGVAHLKLSVDSAVSEDSTCVLLWKS